MPADVLGLRFLLIRQRDLATDPEEAPTNTDERATYVLEDEERVG